MKDLRLRPEEELLAHQYEYRWANDLGAHNMPKPAQLEGQGWHKLRQHPFWPESWLMRKLRHDEE